MTDDDSAKASAAAVQQEVVEEVDDGAEFDMDTLEEELRVQVEYMERELAKVRGSTTSPSKHVASGSLTTLKCSAAMLDHIQVDAYGEMTPLNGVAQVVMKTPQLLIVNPYDNSVRRSAVSDPGSSILYSFAKTSVPPCSMPTSDSTRSWKSPT